jgi:hypothetical protein
MGSEDADESRLMDEAMSGITPLERWAWGGKIERQVRDPDSRFSRWAEDSGPKAAGMAVAIASRTLLGLPCLVVVILSAASSGPVARTLEVIALVLGALICVAMFLGARLVVSEASIFRAGRPKLTSAEGRRRFAAKRDQNPPVGWRSRMIIPSALDRPISEPDCRVSGVLAVDDRQQSGPPRADKPTCGGRQESSGAKIGRAFRAGATS